MADEPLQDRCAWCNRVLLKDAMNWEVIIKNRWLPKETLFRFCSERHAKDWDRASDRMTQFEVMK